MKPITAISLFSGAVDGLAIAAQAAGITVTHHVEWDAWCCRVLRMNHPDSIVLNKDIHDVHDLPPADIIFGGSPCQGWSAAGNQAGFDDPRYLWPEMLRLVRTNRPSVVIHENVRGGVSKGLLDRICDDLEGTGYETTTLVFPACVFGAPHERYRMFIIGLLADPSSQRRYRETTQQITSDNVNWINTPPKQQRRTEFHAVGAGGENVGNSTIIRRERQLQGNPSGFKSSRASQSERRDNRNNEPELGSAVIRTAASLHRLDPVRDFPGWPAGQGSYQHAYEPPRTEEKASKWAKERIEALGNAIVWQQAAPIMRTVVRWLQGQGGA